MIFFLKKCDFRNVFSKKYIYFFKNGVFEDAYPKYFKF